MKKTLTINLNSVVFNIDEDACERLQTYLEELRHHLEQDEREEVIRDIEARIGELFSARLNEYKNVITIEDVESVISTLGSPDSFGPRTDGQKDEPIGKHKRRLYRDIDNKMFGGVASGIAISQDIDVTLVRILLVVLLCVSFGTGLLVYLLLWLIIPEARTVAQKLEMRGIEPTLQNISDYSHNHPQAEQPVSGNGFAKTLLQVIVFLLLLPVILILAFVAVVLIICIFVAPFEVFSELSGIPELSAIISSEGGISFIIIMILCVVDVVIPLVIIIKLIIRAIRRTISEINTRRLVVSLIVWAVLVTATVLLSISFYKDHKLDFENLAEQCEGGKYSGDIMTEIRCDSVAFNKIDSRKVNVVLIPDSVNRVEVTAFPNTLRKVVTYVKDSTLCIDFDSNSSHYVTVEVHYTGTLDNIALSGSANLSGILNCGKNLSVKASSSSEVELSKLVAEGIVTIEQSSAASFDVDTIKANSLVAALSSSSELNVNYLSVEKLEITASSSADAVLSGNAGNVMAGASSSAEIDLSGLKTKSITTNTSSAGEITR